MTTSFLDKLDAQNFGPNDSNTVSAINHPISALQKIAEWISKQVKIANDPNIPDTLKAQATTNLAGVAQLGGIPGAPKSAGGTVGSVINPFNKYIKAAEQLTQNPKNAKRYNNTSTDGRGRRLDMSEYYDISTRDGILSLLDGNASKSKGKGQYTDKMVGLALREGLNKPQSIAIPNLQELDTLYQLAHNVPPRDTKMGHSAWSIANKFGGVLDDINITPNDKTKVQAPGNIGKLVTKFYIDPNTQMDVLQANQVYRPTGYNSMGGRFIYQGSDLEAPIAYPSRGEDYNHLKQFLYDHLDSNDFKNEQKLNPGSLIEFMNANGLSKEDLIKMKQTRSIKSR